MTEREAEEVVEKGGISRRKLLKLAAYSVPTMSLVNMAASSRALALTSLGHCSSPVRVKWVAPGMEGYKAVCHGGGEHNEHQPGHCDTYVKTGVAGQGFVFLRCDNDDDLWDPIPGKYYTWTGCSIPGQLECYQGWINCPPMPS